MKYRKKPVVIEAFQWTGGNTTDLLRWMFPDIEPDAQADELTIQTLEGEMKAAPGDWIIRGVKGEYYPCKPDIFAKTYEPVADSNWKTAPLNPTCEVQTGHTPFALCAKPTSHAYPAMGAGWMALCSEHAQKHLPHAIPTDELIAKGETWA